MKIKSKNANKYKPVKITAPARKSVNSETVIDTILGCMILAAVLLLLGLIHNDGSGLRGFPFEWYGRSGVIRYDNMLASYVTLLAVIAVASVISMILGKANETSISNLPYTSGETGIRANTTAYATKETAVEKPAAKIFPKGTKVSSGNNRSAANSHKEIKPLLKSAINTAARVDHDSKKNQSFGIIVALLTLSMIFIPLAFLDDDFTDDYDSDDSSYDFSTYNVVSETASEATGWLQDGDEDMLSAIGEVPADIALPDLSETESDLIWNTIPVDENEESTWAVFRYTLADEYDDDGDIYLAAVLIEGDDLISWPEDGIVTGIALYKFGSYDEYSDYCDNALELDEPPEDIVDLSKCMSIGKTEIDGTHILCYY